MAIWNTGTNNFANIVRGPSGKKITKNAQDDPFKMVCNYDITDRLLLERRSEALK